MIQADLVNLAGVILEEATKILPQDLADEGISKEEIVQFTTLYTNFKGITCSKREAMIDRTDLTDRMADLFDETAEIKKNKLDRLANQFIRKTLVFYNKYKAATNVIHKHNVKPAAITETKV